MKEQVPHLWPLSRVLQPWPMGERFFWETKRGGCGARGGMGSCGAAAAARAEGRRGELATPALYTARASRARSHS